MDGAKLRSLAYVAFLLLGVLLCIRVNLIDPTFGRAPAFAKWGTAVVRPALGPDIWWQIVAGEEILTTGEWPSRDTYSFTAAGNPWVAYQWLADVLMALAARMGGLQGLVLFLFLLGSLLIISLFYYAYLRSRNLDGAFLACLLVLPALSLSISLRPQLLGYCFLLIALILLERFRQGHAKAIWLLPLVFLLWVNTHGTFPFGFLALGLAWVGGWREFRRGFLESKAWTPLERRRLILIVLLCLLALVVTPYGSRLAAYPLEISFLQPVNVGAVEEWQPLPLGVGWGKSVFALLLLFVTIQWLFPRVWRVDEIALLSFAAYGALVHRRLVILLVVFLAPLLAVQLDRWTARLGIAGSRRAAWLVLVVLAVGGLTVLYPSRTQVEQAVARHYPSRAVAYMQANGIPERLFSPWGGYLRWALGADHKVFIDSRLDMFEYAGVFSDYLVIANLKSNPLYLLEAKYKIDACLIHSNAPLGTVLAASNDWQLVYFDDLSLIYVYNREHKEDAAPVGVLSGPDSPPQ
jgi:hypothetical protein